MTTVDFVYVNAGGGHRASAVALQESIRRQGLAWDVRLVGLQDVLDPIDIARKLTGVPLEDWYNIVLQKNLTFGSKYSLKLLQAVVRACHKDEVRLLREHWAKSPPDMVVSMMPHFNRALKESLEGRSTQMVTILTDLADYPPHFWIERQQQDYICGTEEAVRQARAAGIANHRIHLTSGMVIHPRFYEPVNVDRRLERSRLGLDPELPTGLVLFGGQGSHVMLEIARRLNRSPVRMQLLLICGHNHALADRIQNLPTSYPKFVERFTKEIPYYMSLADFFIGKPGPGSISEALLMHLPVVVQENAWTLPQERYNAIWIRQKGLGVVLRSFRGIVPAVTDLLQPANYRRLRSNAAALHNRAVFEIPHILARILLRGKSSESGPVRAHNQASGGASSVSASGTTEIVQGSSPASSPST